MKIISFILIFLIQINLQLFAQWQRTDFVEPESEEYQFALELIKSNKNTILQNFSEEEAKLAIAIVFPEILRYNAWSDYAETTTLEILYINYGEYYADFSIGYFQMKPSFAEKLESFAQKNQLKSFENLYQYSIKDEVDMRALRLQRLQHTEGQLQYLKLFIEVMKKRFPEKYKKNNVEKLKFYASAYNLNFLASETAINEWAEKEAFPEVWILGQKQYNYTAIAIYFYEHYAQILE